MSTKPIRNDLALNFANEIIRKHGAEPHNPLHSFRDDDTSKMYRDMRLREIVSDAFSLADKFIKEAEI